MKILNIILLVLFVSSFTYGQSWTIGIIGSPNFTSIKQPTGFNHQYTVNPGFSIGSDLTYSFKNKSFSLETGILYTVVNYNVTYAFNYNQAADPSIPLSSEMKSNYLEIPFLLNYNYIAHEKLNAFISGGIIPSILISSDERTLFADYLTRESNYLNSYLTSIQIGTGLKFHLGKQAEIRIEPQYRIYLKGFDKIMEQSPTSILAKVGIDYKFRNL